MTDGVNDTAEANGMTDANATANGTTEANATESSERNLTSNATTKIEEKSVEEIQNDERKKWLLNSIKKMLIQEKQPTVQLRSIDVMLE